jgi:hypothetical protein
VASPHFTARYSAPRNSWPTSSKRLLPERIAGLLKLLRYNDSQYLESDVSMNPVFITLVILDRLKITSTLARQRYEGWSVYRPMTRGEVILNVSMAIQVKCLVTMQVINRKNTNGRQRQSSLIAVNLSVQKEGHLGTLSHSIINSNIEVDRRPIRSFGMPLPYL